MMGPALDVLVTKQCDRYGGEIDIDSLAKDGSPSWRGVERYVTELALHCTAPMRVDTSTRGTERLCCVCTVECATRSFIYPR